MRSVQTLTERHSVHRIDILPDARRLRRYVRHMTVADQQLIDEALTALNAVNKGVIGAPGGQKAVRLVEHAGIDCVLKVVAIGSTSDDTLKRAAREVELLAGIDSPNVVKVKSGLVTIGDPVRGAAWLEEYLDGEDLGPLLGARQWSWDEARQMGIQVSNGLAEGHARKVIHRDLSANNVRRLSDGTYKVLDFGFARHTLRSQVTFNGQPGTPGFLSPEHLNSYSGGPATMSDVFQVGNLMYCALTRKLPYPYTGDDADYITRLRAGAMTALSVERPDLTPEQLEVVNRALHPQPARRFINAASLRDALMRTP